MPLPQRKSVRLTLKILVVVVGVVLVAWIYDFVAYPSQNPLRQICHNKSANGLWLRYFWYAGKVKDATAWQAMSTRLREHQIKYAYFHVLTTASSGKLKWHHLDNARKITSFVHEHNPNTKAIAWLYIGSTATPDKVDLSNPAVRKELIGEMHWLLDECGFDGVQWDYEFCQNGDPGFLKLMEESRAAIARDKLLCADTPMWYPNTLWGWDDGYFRKVAAYADQIAVMGYDSYLYTPSLYAELIHQEAVHVTNDCHGTDCKVILGLPTYEDVTLMHNAHVESFANSLRGLYRGVNDPQFDNTVFDGIALFADYTTDEAEWRDYDRFWLECSQKPAVETPLSP